VSRLEQVDAASWESFVGSPLAVLMLAKTGCAACAAWTQELEAELARPDFWPEVRFGKMYLDQGGLARFKRANESWLADVHDLPYTVLYVRGQRFKSFAGGGIERLESRLRSALEPSPA
jgi:hypothetical protein